MMTFLIAAAAVVGTSDISAVSVPSDDGASETIVVEGRRSERTWEMPKLTYDVPDSCPALVETEIPGFGVLRLRKSCATDRTEEWRLFQY
jgi:hypothetical protein